MISRFRITGFAIAAMRRTSSTLGTGVEGFAPDPTSNRVSRVPPGRGLMIRMQVEDATRRTRLATERTYLAWWRSGLAALAVGLAAGKLVPELSSGAAWPYEMLGVGYSLLGVAFIYCGHHRQREVEAAVRRGEWAPLDARITTALTLAGVLLGLVTVIVVLVGF